MLTTTSRKELFLQIKDVEDLATFLGLSVKKLNFLLYVLADSAKYSEFNIKKKNGSTRLVAAPNVALKRIQKQVSDVLIEIYDTKHSVHGYVKNRSIVSNAKCHIKKRHLLNIDLLDFFPSINFGRVRGLFLGRPFNFPADVATALARLSTKDNSLPQGAPTSPIISNFICWGLDSRIRTLCHKSGCTYTRYADDISISSNREVFPEAVAKIQSEPFEICISQTLSSIIEKNGFQINPEKTRFALSFQSQVVTGLKVNLFPNVPRKFIRQIRAMLHAWETFGLEKAENEYRTKYITKHRAPHLPDISFKKVLHGKLMFLRSVKGADDKLYQKLLGRYALVADLKYLTKDGFHKQINRAIWVLSSDDFDDDYAQGTAFSLENVGAVTCAHVLKKHTMAYQIYDHHTKYPVKVLHKDDLLDYAIIEIVGAPIEVVLKTNKDFTHSIGQEIKAIGFPAHENHASVSITDAKIIQRRATSNGQNWYRIDTNVFAGNSGGPVLDSNLRVIGIVAVGSQDISSDNGAVKNGYIAISDIYSHL